MDEAGADLLNMLDQERKQFIEEFVKNNQDLADRMHVEGVSTVLDTEQDILSLVIGSVRQAVSFSPDGELYLRTDLETHKLLSAELHYFADNLHKNTLPFRLMLDLIQVAGSVQFAVLSPVGTEPKSDLDKDMRELVEA